ncbi:MAG TPA: hypothetical protein DG761_03985 [Gammaproteobacteria bacterium]|jgi:hypothetical protein|nr:hypothetical protein [Acidiferrobacteraceae bacterium]MDP6398626.1 hypothetical protein [Arenicellales bacterium]MDP6552821.1 hypothetical protein [Arenicellales bacterium]MDP6918925.1 hypothetical protein [Arenicellales bacterium]HCX87162.1 hypothetical protein [Gammaproteobacteria bacterium]|tara:strand:- start:112 stop:744 length:633 start_codon:yes stop_codon:yes gene_type:complete
MRWIFALLVLANVALYLWATQLSPKAELGLGEAQAGHNLEAMGLLSEESIVIGARADCLRIGPFSTEQTLSEGRRLLVNKGYGLAQQRTAAREVHAYQVVAGPFRSDIARDNARMRLQEKGVSTRDLAYGDDKMLLLRDYARKSQAEEFATSLDAPEIPVLVKLQARTLGPLYWLDVPDVVTPERKQEFAELKWGDAMTEVTPIPCPKSG